MSKGEVTWHWPEYRPIHEQRKTDNGWGHGSCVASKAAGQLNGVSKYSHLIMLQINHSPDDTMWAFNKVAEEIEDNGRQGSSILIYTAAWLDNPDNRIFRQIRRSIQDLFNLQTVVVVTAGNYGATPGRKLVDTLPALWSNHAFPLIVVGAVDNYGNIAKFSQTGERVTAWAPGVGISCSGDKLNGTGYGYGTSFSAPMVKNTSVYGESKLANIPIRSLDLLLTGWVRLL